MISLVFASRSATLTDVTDLVTTANNHGFSANNQIKFLTITSTTGISTNTWYYVANNVSLTANTFQLTASAGSAVLPLTTNGTATIAIPIHPVQTPKVGATAKILTTSLKFSPVQIATSVISYLQIITAIKFSPVTITSAAISAKARLTNIISDLVAISPISVASAAISAKARLTNIISDLVAISPVTTLKNISYVKPYWTSIDKIKTNFSSIINLPAVISFQIDARFRDYSKVKFTPINIVNVLSSTAITITNTTSDFVKMSFVNTIAVVTRKLPIPRDTWANVTQQVKTLIQFWS
jgi:hypothetical protein